MELSAVADVTPRLGEEAYVDDIEKSRGREILWWVDAQPVKPRAIAVLDDLRLRGPIGRVLVQTREAVGLADADVERAVALLRSRGPLARPWEPEAPPRARSATSRRASSTASPGR